MVVRPNVVCCAGVNESGNKLSFSSLYVALEDKKFVYKIEREV